MKKEKTLYISDLDGALLNKNAELSKYTKTTLNSLIAGGFNFSVATARSFASAGKILTDVKFNIPDMCIDRLRRLIYIFREAQLSIVLLFMGILIKIYIIGGYRMSVDNILEYASACYDFDLKNIERINSGSMGVYKIGKGDQNFYLRLTPNGFDNVSAEIHWMEYLKNDVRVPELVISSGGKLIETFQDDGETYAIYMFRELPGILWKKSNYVWNDKTYFNWGKTMGLMHRLTKDYNPPEEICKRPRFEDNYNPLSNYTPLPLVQEKMARIQNEISALPKDADSYGLIHQDMHQQNFLSDGKNIGVLDFESCVYGHFALDIGFALYHAIWWDMPNDCGDKNGFALEIIKIFMSGYNTENVLSDFWLRKIILFMKYRQIQAISWHLGYYPSKGFTAVVYNERFGIYFDYGQYIKNVENDVFFEGCAIDESVFLNAKKIN